MQKIEEQLGKAKVVENDPTLKLTNKMQKICQLRKEKKLTDKEYSKYIHQMRYHRDCMVQ